MEDLEGRVSVDEIGQRVRISVRPIGSNANTPRNVVWEFAKDDVEVIERKHDQNDGPLSQMRIVVSIAGAESTFVLLCEREIFSELKEALQDTDVLVREIER